LSFTFQILMVKKKNNTWRSYVELNSFIIKNSY
jgi:hypothetical protein